VRASPDLLILDCDGVVVDSEPITIRVLADMLHELGMIADADTVGQEFTGLGFGPLLQRVRQMLGGPLPADFEANYRDRTFTALERDLRPVEGIEAVLDQLRVKYCIASNGPHAKMRKTLGITALLPRFAGRMFSADDVAQGKPSPDLFLFAARHFAADPSRCVVVEDSSIGIAAARAAGMRALGYAAPPRSDLLLAAGAHATFTQMSSLPALLDF
jgi:HAD superfamily hydrolase (TIGR01509 family)